MQGQQSWALSTLGFPSAGLSGHKRSQVIYIVFRPRGLSTLCGSLPWWMLISFPLKCFSLICITLKALKSHPYRIKVQWVITKKVLNSKLYVATCFFFFYIPTISTNKRYENLAASIGSTNETLNQSYSNDFDSLSPYIPRMFEASCASLCQEATKNHMRSCTSPAGRLESHQRGFWIETLLLCPGDLLSKSSKLTFSRKRWWGDSPF